MTYLQYMYCVAVVIYSVFENFDWLRMYVKFAIADGQLEYVQSIYIHTYMFLLP